MPVYNMHLFPLIKSIQSYGKATQAIAKLAHDFNLVIRKSKRVPKKVLKPIKNIMISIETSYKTFILIIEN